MSDIIETDAGRVTAEILADVEGTTGILMPGDERRILVDGLAYAVAHQNAIAADAWAQMDVDKASGDILTARGAALGIARNNGAPAQIWVEFRKADDEPVTIDAGTTLTIGGVQWATNVAVTSSGLTGDVFEAVAEATIAEPVAVQAAAQNSLPPYVSSSVGELDEENPQINRVRVAPRDDSQIAWAEARDVDDDVLFRSRIKDAEARPGDYVAMTRAMLPDAKAVRAVNDGPGKVVVTAIHADAQGYATNYGPAVIALLRGCLRSHPKRLLGDDVTAQAGKVLEAKPSLKVWCVRGFSSAVQAALTDSLADWCRGFQAFGGEYDLGDLIRFLDGQPHVRFVDVVGDASTLDGHPITLTGSPGHRILGAGEFLRMAPDNFTLVFGEVD